VSNTLKNDHPDPSASANNTHSITPDHLQQPLITMETVVTSSAADRRPFYDEDDGGDIFGCGELSEIRPSPVRSYVCPCATFWHLMTTDAC